MDYEYMALTLANLSAIPVRLYRDGRFQKLFHSNKFKPDLAIIEEPNIFKNEASVSYYMTKDFLFYGLFRLKEEPVCMVLGPVAQIPVDRAAASQILLSIGESTERAGELVSYLHSIPSYPLRNFLQIICAFAFFLNGEKITVADILLEGMDLPLPELAMPEMADAHENSKGHNTYELEQTLLSYIEHGRPNELKALFALPVEGRAGTMAQDMLRQQKNLLIVTATLVSRAAIKGGIPQEEAFTLSDLYIQKAELLSSYEGLVKLMMQMTLDFAERVEKLNCGNSGRKLVRVARQYILSNINERLTTDLLASALGRNRTYLCTAFKEETGLTVNEFITETKIDEAKRLLAVTDKSLISISEHLGFSSQSYFQKVFKKHEGITPLEYRNRNRQ